MTVVVSGFHLLNMFGSGILKISRVGVCSCGLGKLLILVSENRTSDISSLVFCCHLSSYFSAAPITATFYCYIRQIKFLSIGWKNLNSSMLTWLSIKFLLTTKSKNGWVKYWHTIFDMPNSSKICNTTILCYTVSNMKYCQITSQWSNCFDHM